MGDLISNPDKYKRGWTGGLPETPCGHGSTMAATKAQRAWIPQIVRAYHVDSIADIGAGDLNWMNQMGLPDYIDYWAYDLVPRQPEIIQFDLIKEVPPPVDLIMCLWVLNHFPYDACQSAIDNLKKSGAKYLMMTDRIRYRDDQPKDIDMPCIEQLMLNEKGDSIKMIDLEAI